MNSSLLQKQDHRVESDKKTIRNESIVLILFGVILLGFTILLFSEVSWLITLLSLPYIITGLIGLIAICNDSELSLDIFKVLIYILLVFNAALGLLSAVNFVYLLAYPTDCSKSGSDSCYIAAAFAVFFDIISAIVAVVCSLIIFFLIIVLNHVKKYTEDQKSANLV